jgi:hypothetical protein
VEAGLRNGQRAIEAGGAKYVLGLGIWEFAKAQLPYAVMVEVAGDGRSPGNSMPFNCGISISDKILPPSVTYLNHQTHTPSNLGEGIGGGSDEFTPRTQKLDLMACEMIM